MRITILMRLPRIGWIADLILMPGVATEGAQIKKSSFPAGQ
jgi:hypothetical protein